MSGAPAGRRSAQGGFALIIVLWTAALLSLLMTQIERAGQNETRRVLNLNRAAALQAEADGAVAVAAFHLLGTAPSWSADGQPHMLNVEDDRFTDRVVVQINDEAAKINLNTAPAPLLQALLAQSGADPAAAGKVAANIFSWRFPAGNGAAAAAVAAPYKAAGLAVGPPSAPFESLDELHLVLGMTPDLLAALLPHLTLFTQGTTDFAYADPVVKHALAAAVGFVTVTRPQAGGLQVVNITATAYGFDGAVFRRQAVVRVGAQQGGWMRVLTWNRPPD